MSPEYGAPFFLAIGIPLVAIVVVVKLVRRYRKGNTVQLTHHDEAHPIIEDTAGRLRDLKYSPTAYLWSGLLQTASADFPGVDIKYKREEITLDEVNFEHGSPMSCCPDHIPKGTVSLDWVITQDTEPHRAIVIIVPGLTGSSDSSYVTKMALSLVMAGYQPVVYNPRGRGGIEITSAFMYSCGYTHDLRRIVQMLRSGSPDQLIFGVGFSLGANYLAKMVGEDGDQCLLDGAACLAAPLDCERLMENLTSGLLGRRIYDPVLTGSLHRVRQTHEEALIKTPHPDVDLEHLRKAKTLWEFDDRWTAKTMGCRDADDYYSQASAKHFLENIAKPLMFLHAENDPIVPASLLPSHSLKKNKNILSIVTSHGGHSMIWPTGLKSKPWSPDVVLKFLSSVQKHR
eukprot:TRINITY_DN16164_c0_g1_i1.p1 TRINITY_DN16164_c0_g1~~TRINITY_DN16164_c0_g1_i1.p1  ORF type:complete len:400 (+),score=46.04 TRINITY_DN16164_c0_g1_i1:31-1230(+)